MRTLRNNGAAETGVSLVEVMVGVVIFMITFTVIVSSVVSAGNSSRRAEMRAIAVEAALSKADEVRTTAIDQLYAKYGPSGTKGDTFKIEGADGDAATGKIRVIVDETLSDAQIGAEFGMPRDLDGDNLATKTNVATTALALPVLVEVSWAYPNEKAEVYKVPVVVLRTD